MKKLLIAVVLMTLLAGCSGTPVTGNPDSLSDKWRIEVSEGAKSDGVLHFRVTPEGQPAIDVRAQIKDGTRENRVAVAIKKAFRAQLPEKAFHIERDDGEDVLVKRRHGAPRFALELISSDVKAVRINLDKE